MKVLVIGGCGFIGSHVVDRLLVRGHTVKVFDRQPERFRAPLKSVEYQYGDFHDRMAVLDALVGWEAVIHLVSTTFPGTADLDPMADVQGNLLGSLALLDSMMKVGVSRLLFLSSGGTVYGPSNLVPIPETHPLHPINSYGIVKASIEYYLEMYRKTRGISTISVRASNPYGPRQGHAGVQGVISTFLNRLLAGEQLEIWGDGTVVRDYLHVRDLAEFCAEAVSSDKVGPFNVGSGEGSSLLDVVDLLRIVTGREIAPLIKPGRKIDVPYSVLDISKAKKVMGWQPETDFLTGLRETWDWVQKESASDKLRAIHMS